MCWPGSSREHLQGPRLRRGGVLQDVDWEDPLRPHTSSGGQILLTFMMYWRYYRRLCDHVIKIRIFIICLYLLLQGLCWALEYSVLSQLSFFDKILTTYIVTPLLAALIHHSHTNPSNITSCPSNVSLRSRTRSLRSRFSSSPRATVHSATRPNRSWGNTTSSRKISRSWRSTMIRTAMRSRWWSVLDYMVLRGLLQELMAKKTGGRSVPRVFVGGQFLGGGDQTEEADRSGELQGLLEAAGAV